MLNLESLNIDGLILEYEGLREEQLVLVLEIMQKEIIELKKENQALKSTLNSIDTFLIDTDYRYFQKKNIT